MNTTSAKQPVSSSEKILAIHRWTPRLWSFKITRPANYLFEPGQYARLGLGAEDARVWRPYSIVSTPADDFLEFLIVLLPEGAFSQRLAALQEGADILLDERSFGFFLPSQLADGQSLWLLATGTGLGPYISILRAQAHTPRFAKTLVIHSCRTAAELAYAEELQERAADSAGALLYLPIVTREAGVSPLSGRIPELITGGQIEAHTHTAFDPASARVMVCGNPLFATAMRRLMVPRQFEPCRRATPGSMLFENYW